jgi:glycosyltransferase involved in cell wall biosynthesis
MADLSAEKLAAKLASRPLIDQAHPFRFYFIGSWDMRKNVERLLEAYFKTGWTMNTPVRLALHCVPAHRDPTFVQAASWKAQEMFKLILESMVGSHGQVALLTVMKPAEWIVDMHLLGDCFVTASHGEGFCYPALDALYVGNAVIGGGGPAVKSLLDGGGGCLPMTTISITPMPECQGYEFGQKWWSVDTDDLTDAMLDAFEAAHERADRTRVAREVRHASVQRRFSYGYVGQLIRARLEVAVTELAARGA